MLKSELKKIRATENLCVAKELKNQELERYTMNIKIKIRKINKVNQIIKKPIKK